MEGYQLKQIKENFGYFFRGKASQLPDIADIAAVADIRSSEMLDWRTNPNLILPTNLRVCPSTVYSDTGFIIYSFKSPVVNSVTRFSIVSRAQYLILLPSYL